MRRHIETLLGPIFNKEAVEIARRPRFYASRTLYGAALLIILVIAWEEMRWYRFGRSYHNAMAYAAQELFLTASVVQYVAVFLFVPMFVCGTIAGEREERTLDLLFATPLRDREIILGKLVSRVAAMACLVVCGLPVLSFVMFFGGVEPESLWRVLAATLMAIFFVGAHAIYFSTVTGSTLGALVRTYWWLALWLLGVPLLIIAVLEEASSTRAVVPYVVGGLSFVNPLFPFAAAVNPLIYAQMTIVVGSWYWAATFVPPLAWSLFLIWRSVRRLRDTPRPVLGWVQRAPWLRKALTWPFFLIRWLRDTLRPILARDQRVPWLRKAWGWWNWPEAIALRRAWARRFRRWSGWSVDNPLWLRARLAPVYDRTGHLGMIQYGGWVVAVFALLMAAIVNPNDIDDEEMSMVFCGFAWGAVAALAALLAGSSMVGDRRRGFLEIVLVTPLTGREIANGGFLAVWEHLRPLVWLPWALGVFFLFTGASTPWGILMSGITATLFGVLAMWHGIACSLAARTTPGALAATFMLPVAVLAGTPLFVGMFEEHHGPFFWVFTALFLAGAAWWRRRRLNLASMATFLIAVHLALGAIASCWTFSARHDELPVFAMHPAVIVTATLDDHPERYFRIPGWPLILPAYWLALVVNIVWLRRWLVRHFDVLAERTSADSNLALGRKRHPAAHDVPPAIRDTPASRQPAPPVRV